MEALLKQVPDILQVVGLLVMLVVFLATVIARLTPTPKDDEIVDSIAAKVLKVLAFFPTLGMNPRTKALEQAYKEYMDQKAAEKKDDAPKAS